MDERGNIAMEEPELVVERIEPIEPQWTPLEEALFLAGLVPVRRVTREELLEERDQCPRG
jgi:hypothetical protein